MTEEEIRKELESLEETIKRGVYVSMYSPGSLDRALERMKKLEEKRKNWRSYLANDDIVYTDINILAGAPRRFLTQYGGFEYDQETKSWKLDGASAHGWAGYKRNKIKVVKNG